MWSLGALLFVLLTGAPPFSEATMEDEEFINLVSGTFQFPDQVSRFVCVCVCAFVRLCVCTFVRLVICCSLHSTG